MSFAYFKKNNSTTVPSRRQWIRSALRWATVGVLAAATGWLGRRNGIDLNRQTCADPQGRVGCRGCGLVKQCGHPKALSFKQQIGRSL
ncbi:hypothetical protein ACQ9LF_07125 [Anaerohalosphaeraceae bacterium U12dextr]